jgi:hypothetical protein
MPFINACMEISLSTILVRRPDLRQRAASSANETSNAGALQVPVD